MFHIVLHQPEIPPNTGNVIRLCANTGMSLHLIKPLGFDLAEKSLRRAGLDYHEYANLQVHDSLEDCLKKLQPPNVWLLTTKAQKSVFEAAFQQGDVLLFGSETQGLPEALRLSFPMELWLRLPMQPHSRSLNLSNAVAVTAYEAWRQHNFVLVPNKND
jgi:tRNA (cytidine/uridine-2'-O-)-methyltransferase